MKQTGKTNLFWPHEWSYMVNTCSWIEKNASVCEFHLENGNLKKLSKKFLEKAKTSSFSLKLFVVTGNRVFVPKNSVICKERQLKIWIDQICKICASSLNELMTIAKKVGHHLK